VAGKTAVKRNRFVQLASATKSVNRALEAKARAVAGLKGYAEVAVMPRTAWVVLAGSCWRCSGLGAVFSA
jgi:hypothetical protein